MHNYLVNASVQIVPIVLDKHPYEWVDEVIALIKQSGVKYEVTPFATVLEGTYDEVTGLLHQINEELYRRGCAEWISNVQLQVRSKGNVTGDEKTGKFRQ